MQDTALDHQISGARAYESLHVPALFSQWCPLVLEAAGVSAGNRVLDVACGTGVLAREASVRVGDDGLVAGVDPNQGMLVVASELAPHIDWVAGSAESLPFADGYFNAACCQFGLMFFSDCSLALREMLRVLRPGGQLAIAVWDSLENSEAYAAEVALLERLAGVTAANAVRVPFRLGDKAALARMFKEATGESVTIETRSGRARFPSIKVMVEAELRGWLPVMGVLLNEQQIQKILQEAESALKHYVTPQGEVAFKVAAHLITCVKETNGQSHST